MRGKLVYWLMHITYVNRMGWLFLSRFQPINFPSGSIHHPIYQSYSAKTVFEGHPLSSYVLQWRRSPLGEVLTRDDFQLLISLRKRVSAKWLVDRREINSKWLRKGIYLASGTATGIEILIFLRVVNLGLFLGTLKYAQKVRGEQCRAQLVSWNLYKAINSE